MSELIIKGAEWLYWDANRSIPDLFWPSDPQEYPTAVVGKTNWAHSRRRVKSLASNPSGAKQGLLLLRFYFWDESRSHGWNNIFLWQYWRISVQTQWFDLRMWFSGDFCGRWLPEQFSVDFQIYNACFIDCFIGRMHN